MGYSEIGAFISQRQTHTLFICVCALPQHNLPTAALSSPLYPHSSNIYNPSLDPPSSIRELLNSHPKTFENPTLTSQSKRKGKDEPHESIYSPTPAMQCQTKKNPRKLRPYARKIHAICEAGISNVPFLNRNHRQSALLCSVDGYHMDRSISPTASLGMGDSFTPLLSSWPPFMPMYACDLYNPTIHPS